MRIVGGTWHGAEGATLGEKRVLQRRTFLAFMAVLAATWGGGAIQAFAQPPAPATKPPSTAPDIKRILDRGKLIVAMTSFDVPPFFMVDANGRFYGLDVSLAEGIAKSMGVGVEYNRQGKTFNDVVDIVIRGEADLAISKLSITPARVMRVRFSQPYLVLRHGLLVNRLDLAKMAKGKETVDVIKDYSGAIGVLAKSSFVDYAAEFFPKAKVVEYPNWEPALVGAVSRGEVPVAYRDELEVKKVIRGNPTAALNLRTILIDGTRDDIAIAVPWDSEQLLSVVNFYLSRQKPLTVNGLLDQYEEIFAKK